MDYGKAAMANLIPEIMPDIAKAAGAAVVGTGRSDFPNQHLVISMVPRGIEKGISGAFCVFVGLLAS